MTTNPKSKEKRTIDSVIVKFINANNPPKWYWELSKELKQFLEEKLSKIKNTVFSYDMDIPYGLSAKAQLEFDNYVKGWRDACKKIEKELLGLEEKEKRR